MIQLERSMEHKLVIDKNVNDIVLLEELVKTMIDHKNGLNFDEMALETNEKGSYRGRDFGSDNAASITMQVRLLQSSYYMMGYYYDNLDGKDVKKKFVPSPPMINILETDDRIEKAKNYLVNLFSLQFPHPRSHTPEGFNIFFGRLLVKLLLENKLNKKLYIDEILWFLPFIEKVTEDIYEELVDSILEFRRLSYKGKLKLFKSVSNHDNLFANVAHEINYYFLRLFSGCNVFDIIEDKNHNNGHLLSFKHSGSTFRNDAFKSHAKFSGYVKLSNFVYKEADILNRTYSLYDHVPMAGDEDIFSINEWITILYETNPLQYLKTIGCTPQKDSEISDIINNMIYASKYGSHDGKEFENSLEPFMYLFKETRDVIIISGAGHTDLCCAMEDEANSIYKLNLEAKTRGNALEGLNANRLNNHIRETGAKYCIVVAPRFARGVKGDIRGHSIVTLKAEEFGAYCYHSCCSSLNKCADFGMINELIRNNLGTDITENVRNLTSSLFSI